MSGAAASRATCAGDFGFLTAALVFAAALAATIGAIRAISYAVWLGMPLVAALALQLIARLSIQRLVPRLALTLALTPMVLSAGAVAYCRRRSG